MQVVGAYTVHTLHLSIQVIKLSKQIQIKFDRARRSEVMFNKKCFMRNIVKIFESKSKN